MKEQEEMIIEVDAKFNSEPLISELAKVEEIIDRITKKVEILKTAFVDLSEINRSQ